MAERPSKKAQGGTAGGAVSGKVRMSVTYRDLDAFLRLPPGCNVSAVAPQSVDDIGHGRITIIVDGVSNGSQNDSSPLMAVGLHRDHLGTVTFS